MHFNIYHQNLKLNNNFVSADAEWTIKLNAKDSENLQNLNSNSLSVYLRHENLGVLCLKFKTMRNPSEPFSLQPYFVSDATDQKNIPKNCQLIASYY